MVREVDEMRTHFECRMREGWSPVPAKLAAEAPLPQGGNAMRSNASLGAEHREAAYPYTSLSLVIPEFASANIRDRRTRAVRRSTGSHPGSPIPALAVARPG